MELIIEFMIGSLCTREDNATGPTRAESGGDLHQPDTLHRQGKWPFSYKASPRQTLSFPTSLCLSLSLHRFITPAASFASSSRSYDPVNPVKSVFYTFM